jgi:hypothetical protein
MSPFHEQIAAMMPPEQATMYRQQVLQQEQREADAEDSIRLNCLEALERVAEAMRYPRISAQTLKEAVRCLSLAYLSAQEFDRD